MHCVVSCLYRILGCLVVVELLRALAFEKCCTWIDTVRCSYLLLELKVNNVRNTPEQK